MLQLLLSAAGFFADAAPGGGGAPGPDAGAGPGGLANLLPIIIVMGLFMYLMVIRPQKKERARQQTLWSSLKKNDHVVTTAGIYGVVTNVHLEAQRVTIRVDESNNTTLRLSLSSIAQVVGDEPAEGPESK